MAKFNIVHTDDRGRVSMGRFLEPNRDYRVTERPDGTVVLEPVVAYTQTEWEKIFPKVPFAERASLELKAEWRSVLREPAPQGVVVETKIHDGKGERNVQTLVRVGNLWFTPDKRMHVYYEPTHWRPLA